MVSAAPNTTRWFTPTIRRPAQRDLVVELAHYLAMKLDTHRPDEASAARVLRELIKNQRLG